jgi:DNA repair photolyase
MGVGVDRSDSLLYEGATGHVRALAPLFADRRTNPSGAKLLLLTKTANVHHLDGLPTDNVVVSFSVNPQVLADLWEGKYPDSGEAICPSVEARLAAGVEAQQMGFEVRLRVDPMLTPPGWEGEYEALFAGVADSGLRPSVVTLGMYRQKNGQLDKWRDKWGLPPVEWDAPVSPAREGSHCRVSEESRCAAYGKCLGVIRRYLPDSRVGLCKETRTVRKTLGLQRAKCNCMA